MAEGIFMESLGTIDQVYIGYTSHHLPYLEGTVITTPSNCSYNAYRNQDASLEKYHCKSSEKLANENQHSQVDKFIEVFI